jgi:hypothetical protein
VRVAGVRAVDGIAPAGEGKNRSQGAQRLRSRVLGDRRTRLKVVKALCQVT